MFESMLDNWGMLIMAAVLLAVLSVAALLSKYVRLMLNIVRDTPLPPMMGPIDYERLEGEQVNFRAFDGTLLRGMFLRPTILRGEKGSRIDSSGSGVQGPFHRGDSEKDLIGEDFHSGYVSAQSRGVIVFCHEYGSDMYSCMRYCRGLLESGFDIFSFDFRSHGSSSSLNGYQPRLWCTDKEISDCQGALAFVKSELEARGLDVNIGLFGISRGAGAALMSAAQMPGDCGIKAVLSDGAYSTDTTVEWSMQKWVHIFARVRFVYENHRPAFWHFLRWLLLKFARVRFKCRFPSLRKSVGHLRDQAVFFIHGRKDSMIKVEQAENFYRLSHEPHYLWIVPQASHNQSVVQEPELYKARTVEFFNKYLGVDGSGGKPGALAEEELQAARQFFASNCNTDCRSNKATGKSGPAGTSFALGKTSRVEKIGMVGKKSGKFVSAGDNLSNDK